MTDELSLCLSRNIVAHMVTNCCSEYDLLYEGVAWGELVSSL